MTGVIFYHVIGRQTADNGAYPAKGGRNIEDRRKEEAVYRERAEMIALLWRRPFKRLDGFRAKWRRGTSRGRGGADGT